MFDTRMIFFSQMSKVIHSHSVHGTPGTTEIHTNEGEWEHFCARGARRSMYENIHCNVIQEWVTLQKT